MKYDSILSAPHWEPRSRPRMPMEKRAAQFQPFDPLEGYEETVTETARETDDERFLDDTRIDALNAELAVLLSRIREEPTVTVTWFEPDSRKSGGAYRTATGPLKKLDEYGGVLRLADGTAIPFERIFSIHSPDAWKDS
jgi:hypothetical protein